jgi:hypothetical protein
MARKFSYIFRRRPGAPDDTAHGESQARQDEHTRFVQAQAKKLWETVSRHRHREVRGR